MRKKLVIFLMVLTTMAVAAGCSSGANTGQAETQATVPTAAQATLPATEQATEPAAAQTAPAAQTTAPAQALIGDAKAKQIALQRVSGAKETDIIKFKLDYDDGRQQYEVEIIYNGMEYDCDIDAVSGEVLSWSEESIYQ